MNKAELIKGVANDVGITMAQSEKVVNAVFSGIHDALKKGKEARFVGFGTFKTVKRAARSGRNPRTGDKLKIPAAKAAKFKPGLALKQAVNSR